MDFNKFGRQMIETRRLHRSGGLQMTIFGLNATRLEFSGTDLDREFGRVEGMIDSMTPLERSYPFLMTIPGRCLRIAEGAGVQPSEVSTLYGQFKAMSEMVNKFEASERRNV
jgi:signal recognition particle subunit SRP54